MTNEVWICLSSPGTHQIRNRMDVRPPAKTTQWTVPRRHRAPCVECTPHGHWGLTCKSTHRIAILALCEKLSASAEARRSNRHGHNLQTYACRYWGRNTSPAPHTHHVEDQQANASRSPSFRSPSVTMHNSGEALPEDNGQSSGLNVAKSLRAFVGNIASEHSCSTCS